MGHLALCGEGLVSCSISLSALIHFITYAT
jgi:hypothetical protein